MRALASPKRKLCSQFSNLSTLTTRKALRADLRSRITDKHPDIARQAAERQGAAQRIWSFPAPLGEDGAAQQFEGVRRAPRGIERANATHRATQWARGVQKRRKSAIYPPKPTVD